ncbi:hypothetical protein, partial [Methylobacterium gregans]
AALALMPWSFARLRKTAGPVIVTINLARFRAGEASLFVWEAFVSGLGKGTSHHDDALLAVQAFVARWPSLTSDILPEPALNHAVSAALASGLRVEVAEIAMPAVVVGVTPMTVADPART